MHNQFKKRKMGLGTELRLQNSFSQTILQQKTKVCYLSPNIVHKRYNYFKAVIVFSKYCYKLADRVCGFTYPLERKLLCVTEHMWLSLKLHARTRKTCNTQNLLRTDSETSINMHKIDIQGDVFRPGGYGALDSEMCCHNSNIHGGNTAITRRHKYPFEAFKIFDVRRRDRISRKWSVLKIGFNWGEIQQ